MANVVRTKFVPAKFPNFLTSNMSVHIFWIQLFTIFRLSPGDKHVIGAFFLTLCRVQTPAGPTLRVFK